MNLKIRVLYPKLKQEIGDVVSSKRNYVKNDWIIGDKLLSPKRLETSTFKMNGSGNICRVTHLPLPQVPHKKIE